MLKPILLLAIATLLAPAASAWGVEGHRLAASGALLDLPPDLAPWFRGQEASLPDHASDPDHWKERDPLERPWHHLDCEPYGGAAKVPFLEATAQDLLGPDLFRASGQVTWIILDRVRRLTAAFKAGAPTQVALEASFLSHFVADLSVPLHTTTNHDGHLTDQKGIHKRWEDDLLERLVAREGWSPEVQPAQLNVDPARAPWLWLQESFSLVPGVLADDRAALQEATQAQDESLGHRYWQAFLQSQGPHVKEQLNLAAKHTAEMILFAWTNAGRPALDVQASR